MDEMMPYTPLISLTHRVATYRWHYRGSLLPVGEKLICIFFPQSIACKTPYTKWISSMRTIELRPKHLIQPTNTRVPNQYENIKPAIYRWVSGLATIPNHVPRFFQASYIDLQASYLQVALEREGKLEYSPTRSFAGLHIPVGFPQWEPLLPQYRSTPKACFRLFLCPLRKQSSFTVVLIIT